LNVLWLQLLAAQQQQQQQLAMLQMMEEAGGFPAASLLSHQSAQGSSNLIYILKSLQVRALDMCKQHGVPEEVARAVVWQ